MALPDCIIHPNAVNGHGYVNLYVAKIDGKDVLEAAHRVAWRKANGPIPKGMHVHHICEVRNCINLDHLELLTPSEHKRRHNAEITHCPQGHEYTLENTAWRGPGRGSRRCHRDQERKRRQKVAA